MSVPLYINHSEQGMCKLIKQGYLEDFQWAIAEKSLDLIRKKISIGF